MNLIGQFGVEGFILLFWLQIKFKFIVNIMMINFIYGNQVLLALLQSKKLMKFNYLEVLSLFYI